RGNDAMVATAQNRFEASLSNVSSIDIDLEGSCLNPGAAYEVNSDGPVTLNFSNGSSIELPAGSSTGNL
ncbi:MAG: hypothetical protein R3194_12495, partial [Limnobacter sp.]|nr:hypothetical protein [Limnobacter sp.]